jgi:hypothetical protein
MPITEQRLTAAGLLLAYILVAALITACTPDDSARAADDLVITDTRICAAVAVYAFDAAGWDQRAVAAHATLNRFANIGEVPDCGSALISIAGKQFDPMRWQNALDAVDAVQSGSFDIPFACVRVDTALPPKAGTVSDGSPLFPMLAPASVSARTQCVLGGLAFVEAR